MIAGLAGWLKQIVAVLFLAGLTELILPNRTMGRYVRLVAGLFIILTIATPLLHWIKSDFIAQLETSFQAMEQVPLNDRAQMAVIQQEGRKLQNYNNQKIKDLISRKAAKEIKNELRRKGFKVETVALSLKGNRNKNFGIEKVMIELRKENSPHRLNKPSDQKTDEVAAIQDIQIEVPLIGSQTSKTRKQQEKKAVDKVKHEQIRAFLRKKFSLPKEVISFK